MEIRYITTDFDFESTDDLNPIVQEIGEELLCQFNQWVNEKYHVSYSGAGSEIYNEPSETITNFCDVIERLSGNSQQLWQGCTKRVADIAFESGNEPKHLTYNLPANLINRLAKLNIEVAVTIYQVGFYSYEKDS